MNINKSKILLAGLMVIVLILFAFIPPVSANGEITTDEDFMEIMTHISEDLEEIHVDMHKIAFAARVTAFSTAAIAGFMFLGVIILFMNYRKKI